MSEWLVREADAVERMALMPEGSIDAIVCDPPYGLEFMGKEWDALGKGWNDRTEASQTGQDKGDYSWFGGNVRPRYGADSRAMQGWHERWATEALRVLKPGGHLLAFGGTRTYHRLACAIEDAGFEVRDSLIWLYGSGFPKSLNLDGDWEGWGTALKPGHEPIVMARKPLTGTVAQNVLEYGTGALNIDGCRIEGEVPSVPQWESAGSNNNWAADGRNGEMSEPNPAGRWPANVLLSPEAAEQLDEQSGERPGCSTASRPEGGNGAMFDPGGAQLREWYGDSGGASRFFYTAKASRGERNAGLDGFEERAAGLHDDDSYRAPGERKANHTAPLPRANVHPTVKPIGLMRWLVRLVTPPSSGTICDPFAGSGTTGIAAVLEGFDFIGIERESEYCEIARARIAWWENHAGRDTEDVLIEAGFSERLQREHSEAGQLELGAGPIGEAES